MTEIKMPSAGQTTDEASIVSVNVKVGDTVQISYEGEIDETSGNTIAGAISAFKATISDGDVLIPE